MRILALRSSLAVLCLSFLSKPRYSTAILTKTYMSSQNTTLSTQNFPHLDTTSGRVSYLDASTAKAIDETLMATPGFSIDQLMELAGLSVASAIHKFITEDLQSPEGSKNILIVCGPGNNGGDGLVAARHIYHFGYSPTIYYPKPGKGPLFTNLVAQLEDLGIPVLSTLPTLPTPTHRDAATDAATASSCQQSLSEELDAYQLVVDAVFGFSFSGAVREPFVSIIEAMRATRTPVLSVDIPSGWNVDSGDDSGSGFVPRSIVSLTAPKLCTRGYSGVHFLGGRFVSPRIASQFNLSIPHYGHNSDQVIRLQEIHSSDTSSTSGQPVQQTIPTAAHDTVDGEQLSVMFATAASQQQAKDLAKQLLRRRLIACANLIPSVTSVYVWEGQEEESSETLLVLKTRVSLIGQVSAAIKELHSYEVPEAIAVGIIGGHQPYMDWVKASTPVNPST